MSHINKNHSPLRFSFKKSSTRFFCSIGEIVASPRALDRLIVQAPPERLDQNIFTHLAEVKLKSLASQTEKLNFIEELTKFFKSLVDVRDKCNKQSLRI